MSELELYVARLLMIDDLKTMKSNFANTSKAAQIIEREIDELTEHNVEDMQSRYHDRLLDHG